MSSINLIVGKGMLTPHDEAAREMLAKYRPGDIIEVEELDQTDGYLRRKIFALINMMAKSRGQSVDETRWQLLIAVGWYTPVTQLNGRAVYLIHSMDRRALKGKKLRQLWADLVSWLEREAPKLPHDLALEISVLIGNEAPTLLPDMPEEDKQWAT